MALINRRPEDWPVIEKATGTGDSQAVGKLVNEFERPDTLVRLESSQAHCFI